MSDKRLKLETIAQETVQKTGFNSLSFRTLASAVGVKSSSVHYYFPEKSDLARTLIENYTEEFKEYLTAINKRKLGPGEKLEALVDIFEQVLSDEHFCLCGMMAAEVANLNEANKTLLRQYFQSTEQWLTDVLEQDIDCMTSDLPPEQLAKIIMSGLEGAILLDRVAENHDRLQAQRELVRLLVK